MSLLGGWEFRCFESSEIRVQGFKEVQRKS